MAILDTPAGRGLGRRLATAAILVATMFVALAADAQAYVTRNTTGSPGTVSFPKTAGIRSCGGWTLCDDILLSGQKTVTESYPYRNSAQQVCVTTRFWIDTIYAGGVGAGFWSPYDQATDCVTIPATSSSAKVGGRYTTMVMNGEYATDFVVTWRLLNGTLIGKQTFDFVHTGDYRCDTSLSRVCMVTKTAVGSEAGLLYLGSFG